MGLAITTRPMLFGYRRAAVRRRIGAHRRMVVLDIPKQCCSAWTRHQNLPSTSSLLASFAAPWLTVCSVPGERLPPARQLAEGLGINVHTMLRAFSTLRHEGLLEVRRGRGTIVTGHTPSRADLITRVKELVEAARSVGMSNTEILQTVEVQL